MTEERKDVDLLSVLDRIESAKVAQLTSSTEQKNKRQRIGENQGESKNNESDRKSSDGNTISEQSIQQPVIWYEIHDATSGQNYYYNYITQETTWDKPSSFVPYAPPPVAPAPIAAASAQYPLAAPTEYSNYSSVAFFNRSDGRFGGVGMNHWEQVK